MKFFKKGKYAFPRVIGEEFYFDNGMFQKKNSNGFYPMRLVQRKGNELKVVLAPERIEGVKLEQGQYIVKVKGADIDEAGFYSLKVESRGLEGKNLEFVLEGCAEKIKGTTQKNL